MKTKTYIEDTEAFKATITAGDKETIRPGGIRHEIEANEGEIVFREVWFFSDNGEIHEVVERRMPLERAVHFAINATDAEVQLIAEARTKRPAEDWEGVPAKIEIGAKSNQNYDALHTIEQDGRDVVVSESWIDEEGGTVHKYAVKVPLDEVVHVCLNSTAAERLVISERIDWRGVDEQAAAPRGVRAARGPCAALRYLDRRARNFFLGRVVLFLRAVMTAL